MTRVLLGFLIILSLPLLAARLIYGGGSAFPGVSAAAPVADSATLEVVVSYSEPVGSVAVAKNGDVFFTVHPASRTQGNQLLRYRDGIAMPFPDGAAQQQLLQSASGLTIDDEGRLWCVDAADHGRGQPRVLAFDIETGEILHQHDFAQEIAPFGSYLQAVVVTPDTGTVLIADTSVLRKRPALISYRPEMRTARRLLEQHAGVQSQDYVIDNSFRRMTFFGGILSLMPGISGLAIDDDGGWLYFAATSNDGLFRRPLASLNDPTSTPNTVAGSGERCSDKPLSEGLGYADDTVFVTDGETHAIMQVSKDRRIRTLLRDRVLRWPDGVWHGEDNSLYVADSALPAYLLADDNAVKDNAPYRIYRLLWGAGSGTSQ